MKPSEKIKGIVFAYNTTGEYDMVHELGAEWMRLGICFPWKDKMFGTLSEHYVSEREEILRVLAGEKLESSKKSRQYQAMRDAERRRAERKSREGGKKDAKEPGAGNPSEAPESPAEPEPGKAESEGKEDGE